MITFFPTESGRSISQIKKAVNRHSEELTFDHCERAIKQISGIPVLLETVHDFLLRYNINSCWQLHTHV